MFQKLKSVIACWGIQKELVSNNGTQCKSAFFDEFKAEYGFKHTTSSPHHPQANGSAETGMQIAKQLLEQGDTFLALMAYHATPVPATEKTPSELIMGRQIQTTMQTMANILEPKLPTTAAVKESFDRRNGTRELPQLQPGLWVGAKPDTEKQRTTEA